MKLPRKFKYKKIPVLCIRVLVIYSARMWTIGLGRWTRGQAIGAVMDQWFELKYRGGKTNICLHTI